MRWVLILLVTFALLAPAARALAVQPDEMLPDPALEARARALSKELRCMVCQNQSIDDSDAPLARDLRILVREHLRAGETDQQVLDFLIARYGEFVLLRPRFSPHTVLLWLTPLGVLVIGALGIAMSARRQRSSEGNLTTSEEARLAEILQRKNQKNAQQQNAGEPGQQQPERDRPQQVAENGGEKGRHVRQPAEILCPSPQPSPRKRRDEGAREAGG